MNNRVYQRLSKGVTLVTSTQRLARNLRHQYANEQVKQGRSTWETPDILPWTAWCKRQFQTINLKEESPLILLSSVQQQWIWQEIIKQSRFKDKVLQIRTTAKQAIFSYQQCKAWSIPIFPKEVYLNEDAYAFQQWTESYEQYKQNNNYLDETNLVSLIITSNDDKLINLPSTAFYGFDVFTKQQTFLLDTLKKNSVEIETIFVESRNETIGINEYVNEADEWTAAAAWARQKLEEQANARIGIVSQDLNSIRNRVVHAFESVFQPIPHQDSESNRKDVYSISTGKPLSSYALIDTALMILSLGKRVVEFNTISKLLHSPYIHGYKQELSERVKLDLLLRQHGENRFGFKNLYWLHDEKCQESERCKIFIESIKSIELSILSEARNQSLKEWAVLFSEWLKIFSWPGERKTDSHEQQTVKAWQTALTELASLGQMNEQVSFTTALYQLNRIVADTRFQPETEETAIQVLGMTGAAGMQFDYLWVTGMQDDKWPEKASIDPFIPKQIQRQYVLPDANADARYQQAEKITRDLINSALDVQFSYLSQQGDREYRVSPLIRHYPVTKNSYLQNYPNYKELVRNTANLESYIDNSFPFKSKQRTVKGGSQLFKDQAACPFRAFARHRLYTQSLPDMDIGLNAIDRGNLVHRSLQFLWQRLKGSENLHYKSESELDTIIESVVDETIKHQQSIQPGTFTDRFTELEKQRLQQLLKDWLLLEKQRKQFRVIATEEKRQIVFDGIELQLRIDRIDEIEAGLHIIIDYKTGQVSKSDWDGNRPGDPQLPLYAVTSNTEITGLAYASLKPGQLRFIGCTESDDLLPLVKANKDLEWNDQLDSWRDSLSGLAKDFLQGNVSVDPIEPACRYCDLHSLCRIHDRVESPELNAEVEDD